MALFPLRSAASGLSPRAPWQPRVGTYPGEPAAGPTLLDMLARPQGAPPAPFAPQPPAAPAAPLTAGSVPLTPFDGSDQPPGLAADDNFGLDAGELGMSWQDFALGPGATMLGALLGGVPATALGMVGGMVFDQQRGAPIGTTTSITDIALQALDLPRTRDMLTDVFAPPAPPPAVPQVAQPTGGLSGFQQGFVDAGYSVDPATGVIGGSGPFAGSVALSPGQVEALGMGPGLPGIGGGFGGFGGGEGGLGGSAGSPGGGGGGFGGEEGTSSVWMTGGYTGAGRDGVVQPHMPAGTAHEGEGILNAAAMRHYGDAGRKAVAAINARSVPKNRLAALVRGR